MGQDTSRSDRAWRARGYPPIHHQKGGDLVGARFVAGQDGVEREENHHQRGASIMRQGLLGIQYREEKRRTGTTGMAGVGMYVEMAEAMGLRGRVGDQPGTFRGRGHRMVPAAVRQGGGSPQRPEARLGGGTASVGEVRRERGLVGDGGAGVQPELDHEVAGVGWDVASQAAEGHPIRPRNTGGSGGAARSPVDPLPGPRPSLVPGAAAGAGEDTGTGRLTLSCITLMEHTPWGGRRLRRVARAKACPAPPPEIPAHRQQPAPPVLTKHPSPALPYPSSHLSYTY